MTTKQRLPGEPWYTAIYRDPHTRWWAPALFIFPIMFVLLYLATSDSLVEAAAVSGLAAVAYTAGCLFRRRSRT